ncbi:GAF domain-containing protein [Streptomyces sp. NPDC059680]|uniref:GAF domain-containing protein n=1 Tax=Streptomyces sp. NPDC059680 TaxID=3346904 RepID=UPI0036BC35E1
MDPREGDHGLGTAVAARRRAALAHERADRAEALAEQHEHLAMETGRDFHTRIAQTHRTTAACHRTAARLQEDFARRAAAWDQSHSTRPRFMTGVAEACGTSSVAVTLVDARHNQLAIAVSDQQSQLAQELEFMLDEGPTRDAASTRHPLHVSGPEIEERWPGYGAALATLRITTVAALPLPPQDSCMGVLTIFDPQPHPPRAANLTEVASALSRIMLLDPDADTGLYGEIYIRPNLIHAADIVSAQLGQTQADALALIKARAFAEEQSTEAIARQIVHENLKID